MDDSVTLTFDDLSFEVPQRGTILHAISGQFFPGTLTAVIGPSGAGKSTLSDLLAQRKADSGRVSGSITVNGLAIGPNYKSYCGYCTQEDSLVPTSTCVETLRYYADLRLPTAVPESDKLILCQRVLSQLGLTHHTNSYVGGILPGGRKLPGLSGGEKRRLMIGCALVTNPRLLILDEPTSGLDAAAAYGIVEMLTALAREGRTIVASVHQPRSKIFASFDQVILLAKGRRVYSGPPLGVIPFFEQKELLARDITKFDGLSNVADWCLDLISGLTIPEIDQIRVAFDKHPRSIPAKVFTPREEPKAKPTSASTCGDGKVVDIKAEVGGSDSEDMARARRLSSGERPDIFHRFVILLRRSREMFVRNAANSWVRIVSSAFVGVLLALPSTALALTEVDTRIRVIYGILQTATLLPFAALGLFMSNRTLFNSERASELYGSLEYYCAGFVMESLVSIVCALCFGNVLYWIPGLNPNLDRYAFAMFVCVLTYLVTDTMAITMANALPNSDMAFSIGGAIMTVWFGYAGFFLKLSHLPKVVAWIRFVNPLRYSFQALVMNEFDGVIYPDCSWERAAVGLCIPNGNAVIDAMGFVETEMTKNTCAAYLFVFLVVWHVLSYLSLRFLHKEKR